MSCVMRRVVMTDHTCLTDLVTLAIAERTRDTQVDSSNRRVTV
jgi:hypothetical protein